MKKIFVTDGRSLAALAIIRSFGEKGFEVHCGEDFKHNLSSYSRYIKKRIVYPSSATQPSQFIEYLLDLTKKEKYEIIIPVRDETTILLAKHKNAFLKLTRLYLADYNTILKFRDKGKTVKLAQQYGIPTPKTYFPESQGIEEIKESVSYPILIRARISSGSRGIIYVNSTEEFDEAYNSIKKEYGEPLIQEYIYKTGYSTACILLDDTQKEIASFSYRRIKEYPITGGPTVVGISSEDSEVISYSLKLLKRMNWKGAAEIEYILDRNGNPLLLEVNPRFWMPLNLSIKAGVDFPYLMYQLAIGEKIGKVTSYKTGLKYRWVLPNEILWLTQTSDKIKGIKEFFDFGDKNTCYGDLSISDPLPVFGIMMQSFDFLFDREKRKMIFERGLKKSRIVENKSKKKAFYIDKFPRK